MNAHAAACQPDVDHHRNHFAPAVRDALGLLDRVAEGQPIAPRHVAEALRTTGDIGHRAARSSEIRERTLDASGWEHVGAPARRRLLASLGRPS